MIRTEFGTGALEFTKAIESGPPYLVRYRWAGGDSERIRRTVTEAIAACFGLGTLEDEQRVELPTCDAVRQSECIRYTFWLLRVCELSLGFTYRVEGIAPTAGGPVGVVCRVSIQVDRSRYREEFGDY